MIYGFITKKRACLTSIIRQRNFKQIEKLVERDCETSMRHKKGDEKFPVEFPFACWLLIASTSITSLRKEGKGKSLFEIMQRLEGAADIPAYQWRLLMMLGLCTHNFIFALSSSFEAGKKNCASNYILWKLRCYQEEQTFFSVFFSTRSKFNENFF